MSVIDLITFNDNNKLIFHKNNLLELINNIPNEQKYAIVSIVGPYRTGKSFFLNLLIDHLNSSKYETINKIFDTNYGIHRVTNGIIMSNGIDITINNEPIKLFILDTPGLFDMKLDKEITMKIFGIISLISSLTIYNLEKRVQEDDLENIALFSEYSKLLNESTNLLQSLSILVRDYQNLDDFTEYTYESYCQDYLKLILNSKINNITRKSITSSYDHITLGCLPHPGFKVTKKNFEFKKSSLGTEFKKYMSEYLDVILKIDVKKIGNHPQTIGNLSSMIEKYTYIFNNSHNLPKIFSLLEAVQECQISNLKSTCLDNYRKSMDKIIEGGFLSEKSLINRHKSTIDIVLKLFDDANIILDNSVMVFNARNVIINDMEISFYRYIEINSGKDPLKNLRKYATPKSLLVGGSSAFVVKNLVNSCHSNIICYTGYYIANFIIIMMFLYLITLIYFSMKSNSKGLLKKYVNNPSKQSKIFKQKLV